MWTDVYGDMQDHGPVHRHHIRLLRSMVAGLDYRTVLDIGCGAAQNVNVLAGPARAATYDGVDISDVALERARRLVPSGQFSNMDIQRSSPDGQWDLVNCSFVLEHLHDDEAALANIRAAAGRYLVASTIGGNYERYRPWEEHVGHVRNYRASDLEAKLDKAGFALLRLIEWGFPFYSPIARRVQNHTSAGSGELSRAERAAAWAMHKVYFLNSSRRGDILIALAEAR